MSVRENVAMFHIKAQGRVDVVYLCLVMVTSKKQPIECTSIWLVKASYMRDVRWTSTFLTSVSRSPLWGS